MGDGQIAFDNVANQLLGAFAPYAIAAMLALSLLQPVFALVNKILELCLWIFNGGVARFMATPSVSRILVVHSMPLIVWASFTFSGFNRDIFRTFIFWHLAGMCVIAVAIYAPQAWRASMQPWPFSNERDFQRTAVWRWWAMFGVWVIVVNIWARPWPMHGWVDEFNTLLTTIADFEAIPFIEIAYRFDTGQSFQDSLRLSLTLWILWAIFIGVEVMLTGPMIF